MDTLLAEQFQLQFNALQQAFAQQPMPSATERRAWLQQLLEALLTQQDSLAEAINQDFGQRCAVETRLTELLPSVLGIRHARRHLKRWMKPQRRQTSLIFKPARAQVFYQPVGVVGIVVPWNSPLFLAVGPLTSALAAGNRVMIKLSEQAPAFAAAFKALIEGIFPENLVCVVEGDVNVAHAFTQLPFDHLLFTGSTAAGRQVLHAAADNLTPVTLELGGKSPVIIGPEASIPQAAEQIAFAKLLNAGQLCVAPDYILVQEAALEPLIAALKQAVQQFYPQLQDNPDCTWIINAQHKQRLQELVEDAQIKGAQLISLHPDGQQDRLLPLQVLTQVNERMRVVQEEIFGPILPIVTYSEFAEALDYVRQSPRPLALYYYGHNSARQRQLLAHTHAGGVSFNAAVLHAAQPDLPFGGIGPSGMGNYHGRDGFLTFSHAKAVFSQSRFHFTRLIYPPYGGRFQTLIERLYLRR